MTDSPEAMENVLGYLIVGLMFGPLMLAFLFIFVGLVFDNVTRGDFRLTKASLLFLGLMLGTVGGAVGILESVSPPANAYAALLLLVIGLGVSLLTAAFMFARSAPPEPCPYCKGRRWVREPGLFGRRRPCEQCAGTGVYRF
jgi:hypothetical protein